MKVRQLLLFVFLSFYVTTLNAQMNFRETELDRFEKSEILRKANKTRIPWVENAGQVSENIAFSASTLSGKAMVSTDGEILYQLPIDNKTFHTLSETFVSGDEFSVTGENPSDAKVNYFKGSDEKNWRRNASTFQTVTMGEVWKGVEVKLNAYGNNVEKLFYVNPGVDVNLIQVQLDGAEKLSILHDGKLQLQTEYGTVEFTSPVAYQIIDGEKVDVDVVYSVSDMTYGFEVADYNSDYVLVIDPLLASTYLGGSGNDYVTKVIADDDGTIIIIGNTTSTDFPVTASAYATTYAGGTNDMTIARFSADMSTLISSTYVGGSVDETIRGIAFDDDGNIYLSGYTNSSDMPIVGSAYSSSFNGGSWDGFVMKMSSGLDNILASTYVGSADSEYYMDLKISPDGNIVVIGNADSQNYPVTASAYDQTYSAGLDIVVTVLSSDLSTINYSTYIGGSGDDTPSFMCLDNDGNILFSGHLLSADYPVSATAFNPTYAGGGTRDGFVTKLDPTLSTLMASTYIGGSGEDRCYSVAVDAANNIFVSGHTLSTNFPTTAGAYDETWTAANPSFEEIYISKFDDDLSSLLASTYFGGNDHDYNNAPIMLDDDGNVFIVAMTINRYGVNYPTTSGALYTSSNGSYYDFAVSKFSNDLTDLHSSTYIGLGNGNSYDNVACLDNDGNIIFGGFTYATNLPMVGTPYDNAYSVNDMYFAKLTPNLNGMPYVYANPVDMETCPGDNAFFQIKAATDSYQWQVDEGSGFVNITDGGIYGGATTDSLVITGATTAENGFLYQCVLTNGTGSVNSTSATLTVVDDITPVADVADLPEINEECSTTVTAPTATDNCAGSITATTTDPVTYTAQGTYTINWLYEDGNGNSSSQSQTVVIADVTAPVADVADLPEINEECSATVTAPTATDNCAGSITATTTDPVTYTAQGTYTINWLFEDGNGNSSNQSQTVVIADVTAPVADVADLPEINEECSATVAAPTATDNCAGSITATTTDPVTYTAQGTYTINWLYEDGNGNSSNQSQTVVISDVTAPVADVADLPEINEECSATVTAPTATDNCAGSITATTTDPVTYTDQGLYTINWLYEDGNGNSLNQTQTVVIVDVTAPVADVADLPAINEECGATVTAPTATDNCAGSITATTTDPVTYTDQGLYTINWLYEDGNGNSSNQSQTVVISDVTAPVADVADLPEINEECSATVAAPTAADNCAGSITATTTDPVTYTAQGTYTINWLYEDGNGNSSNQSQTVVIADVTAPVADVADLPEINEECSATVTAPTATDNCAGSITATTTDPVTYTAQGTYTINWLYEDGNGNSSNQSQTVVIADVTAPVADVADLPEINEECSATVTAPTATDNCAGSITATTTDPVTYTAQGTYTINWLYEDGNGNSSTQTQTVVIADVTAPVADVADLPEINEECSATVTAPTATDNCAGSITATTTDPVTYTAQGTYTINWLYEDGNGNSSNQSQTVVIADVTAPVADVADLPEINEECSATVTAPTATDNCAGSITATTTDPVTYTAQGTYTINWLYEDGNGNSSTQTQTVVIADVTAPVADVADLPEINEECSATVTAPTATDNCAGSITATTTDPVTYTAQGTYTINWLYEDGNGNSSNQSQTVVIADVTAPVADVADLPEINEECSATVTAPTATDNCAGSITATTTDPVTYTAQGTYTINWLYEDGNGNSSNQSQTVVIADVTAPVADVADLPEINEECSATVTAPTATDNCAGSITATTADPVTYSAQGTYTINWLYEDGNGNSSNQTQTVVIADISLPSILCAGELDIDLEEGESVYVVSADELDPQEVTDNCTDYTVSNDMNDAESLAGESLSVGTHTITWTVIDAGGNTTECSMDVTVNAWVGLSASEDVYFSLYPNPSKGMVYMETGESLMGSTVELIDIAGRKLQQFELSEQNMKIDLSRYISGVYFIRVSGSDIDRTERIIIQE